MKKIIMTAILLPLSVIFAGTNTDTDKIKTFLAQSKHKNIESIISILEKMQQSPGGKYTRAGSNMNLYPSEANVLIGGYAIVHYTFGSGSYEDELRFEAYTDGTITGYANSTKFMVCVSSRVFPPNTIAAAYTYACMAKTSPSSSYADFYLFNIDNNTVSGYYDFGTTNTLGYDIALQHLVPMWGTFYKPGSANSNVSSSSSLSNSSSQSSHQPACLPGMPCGDASTSSSSCNITLGTLEDYENNTSVSTGTIAFTREVVNQIVEHEKEKCRQDPKSCGINAIPIITTKSDTKAILDKLNGIPKQISGYYVNYGQEAYDWIYIPAGLSSAYKLEKGVDENYRLRWTPFPSNTKIHKSGNTITLSK